MPAFRGQRQTLRLKGPNTRGRTPIKHSGTLVATIGPATVPGKFSVLVPSGGARSAAGLAVNIQQNADTDTQTQIGSICKYVTFFIEAAATDAGKTSATQGWLEWAVTFENEQNLAIPITNMALHTLGDVAMQMFRQDCLLTGVLNLSVNQPQFVEIKVKLPRRCCQMKLGNRVSIFTSYRDSDAADVSTDIVRLIRSFSYKNYDA